MHNLNLLIILAFIGKFVNSVLAAQLEFAVTECKILRSKFKGNVPLSQAEKLTLAKLAKDLGKKYLSNISIIVTPETLFKWYRDAIKKKWDY